MDLNEETILELFKKKEVDAVSQIVNSTNNTRNLALVIAIKNGYWELFNEIINSFDEKCMNEREKDEYITSLSVKLKKPPSNSVLDVLKRRSERFKNNEKVFELDTQIEKLKEQLVSKERSIIYLNKVIDNLKNEYDEKIDILKSSSANKDKEIKRYQRTVDELSNELRDMSAKYDEQEKDLNTLNMYTVDLEHRENEKTLLIKQVEEQMARVKQEKVQLAENYKVAIQNLNIELNSLRKTNEKTKGQLKMAIDEKKELTKTNRLNKKIISGYKNKVVRLKDDKRNLNDEMFQKENTFDQELYNKKGQLKMAIDNNKELTKYNRENKKEIQRLDDKDIDMINNLLAFEFYYIYNDYEIVQFVDDGGEGKLVDLYGNDVETELSDTVIQNIDLIKPGEELKAIEDGDFSTYGPDYISLEKDKVYIVEWYSYVNRNGISPDEVYVKEDGNETNQGYAFINQFDIVEPVASLANVDITAEPFVLFPTTINTIFHTTAKYVSLYHGLDVSVFKDLGEKTGKTTLKKANNLSNKAINDIVEIVMLCFIPLFRHDYYIYKSGIVYNERKLRRGHKLLISMVLNILINEKVYADTSYLAYFDRCNKINKPGNLFWMNHYFMIGDDEIQKSIISNFYLDKDKPVKLDSGYKSYGFRGFVEVSLIEKLQDMEKEMLESLKNIIINTTRSEFSISVSDKDKFNVSLLDKRKSKIEDYYKELVEKIKNK